MEKRLLLAVTISIVVMLVYQSVLTKLYPPKREAQRDAQLVQNKVVTEILPQEVQDASLKQILPVDAVFSELHTAQYDIVLSNIGGSIQKVRIKEDKRIGIDIVDSAVYEAGILSLEGKGALKGLSSASYIMKAGDNSYSYAETNGLRIEKTVEFLKDKYALVGSIKIINQSNFIQPLSFEITTASAISTKEIDDARYIMSEVLNKNGKLKKIASGKFKDNKVLGPDIEWLALKNKYYSIIAKPDFTVSGVFTRTFKNAPLVGIIVDNEQILPNESKIYNIMFYIGPTELNELEKVDPVFGKALNYGMFTSIGLVLLSVLNFFYRIFHNYGIAIFFLTLCVSLLLFPLSFKSMQSMRKLQELQPHVEKIRLEHKDNPHKLNKEIMEIYRRYKVNPMSGCLPMVFQMPIFIALYQTLMKSVELKGASFLWIKDLSMPDAAFHLPFTIPFLGNAINMLPILMIGAMILQQKVSQVKAVQQSDQQRLMTNIMPIMFGVIFYSLPAGLVLYWLTNTIITSTMQFLMLRKA